MEKTLIAAKFKRCFRYFLLIGVDSRLKDWDAKLKGGKVVKLLKGAILGK
jgi:hypothetical protein